MSGRRLGERGATVAALAGRSVSPQSVRPDGPLTSPRTYGVYELSGAPKGTRRFRMGNHPVRMRELQAEFGGCKMLYLFVQRSDAVDMAAALNDELRSNR